MKTILIKPMITEKNTTVQEMLNQYAFEVGMKCNKIEIAKAVEKKFNVRVTKVRTLVAKGKKKAQLRRKGKFEGYRADRKKAIVTLNKDDKIDFLGNIE